MDSGEPELSEDEGLPPDQPAFTGLFPQSLFKSLLLKAINTAQLGSTSEPAPPQSGPGSFNSLFTEPAKAVTYIPTPPLFLEVLKKQWASPGSAPVLTSTDKRNFNVSSDLDSLLQVPPVDAPIAALVPNVAISRSPGRGSPSGGASRGLGLTMCSSRRGLGY